MDERHAETCIRHSLLILSLVAFTYTASAQTSTDVRRIGGLSLYSVAGGFGDAEFTPTLDSASEIHENEIADVSSQIQKHSISERDHSNGGGTAASLLDGTAAVIQAEDRAGDAVEWKSLMLHSNFFLGIMHGFRIAKGAVRLEKPCTIVFSAASSKPWVRCMDGPMETATMKTTSDILSKVPPPDFYGSIKIAVTGQRSSAQVETTG